MVFKGKMWGLMVIIGVLLVMVPKSMQLMRPDHPLHSVVEKINAINGPSLAIILSSVDHEKQLLDSGYFVPNSFSPAPVIYAGRTFKFGLFKGVPCTYVIARGPLSHISATVQILVDLFHIVGIIDYGAAGAVSDVLAVGDVAVVDTAAFTGYWKWQEGRPSVPSDLPSLSCGDFNLPTPGANKLDTIEFQTVHKDSLINTDDRSFWFHANEAWLEIAKRLKDLPLERCILDATACILRQPKLVYGVKCSCSDIFVENKAYGKFLNEKFDVSIVDKKSAAVISTANANAVPVIVVRAVTNKPGVPYDATRALLADRNALNFCAAFVLKIQIGV